jgi:predicted acyl esterase
MGGILRIPAYVVASWTNLLHTAGTIRGWRQMASKDKWLRVHNTHEWNDYYNGEVLELVITGTDLLVRPEFPQIPPIPTINKGRHRVHAGGRYDAHLLLPVIPMD